MYTIKNYVTAESLEQAAALKEKGRNNVIIGGNLWLKMGRRSIQNAIDLSRLHLDGIEEDAEGFRIGCMVTLRELEVHEGLKGTFGNIFKEAVRHIVGVQFRNLATVGGSIFPRFGFSDVLTAFMSCDSYVELYRGGRIPIREFAEMPLDNDILTHIYIKTRWAESPLSELPHHGDRLSGADLRGHPERKRFFCCARSASEEGGLHRRDRAGGSGRGSGERTICSAGGRADRVWQQHARQRRLSERACQSTDSAGTGRTYGG